MSSVCLEPAAPPRSAHVRPGVGTVLIAAGRLMVAAGVRLVSRQRAVEAAGRRYREYEETRGRLQALSHSGLPPL